MEAEADGNPEAEVTETQIQGKSELKLETEAGRGLMTESKTRRGTKLSSEAETGTGQSWKSEEAEPEVTQRTDLGQSQAVELRGTEPQRPRPRRREK